MSPTPSPHISTGRSRSTSNPFLVKLPKSRITAHLHSFIPLFPHLSNKLPHSFQSHSSLQVFKKLFTTISYLPPSKTSIFSTPLIHPKSTSLKFPAFLPETSLSCKVLKVPVVSILYTPCSPPHLSPFHRFPNVSVTHCFVLPSPTLLV